MASASTVSVVSESSVVPSALSAVVSPVVSESSVVPSALSAVVASSVVTFFPRLFWTDRNGDTNQCIHVQRTVDMSDVGKRMVGTSNDAVDLSDVGTVI